MKRFTVAVVALSGCVLGPACQALVGIEDRVEAPPLGDDGGTEAAPPTTSESGVEDGDPCAANPGSCLDPDAAPPAGCPANCLPPAPAGWTGPSATYDGAESTKPDNCPAWYTEKEVEAHQGLTAAAATCDCGAATVTGRSCSAAVTTWPVACDVGTPTKLGTVTTKDCFTTNSDVGAYYRVSTGTLVPGTCTYPNAQTTLPAQAFQKVNVACSLPQTTACENRPDCVATPAPDQPYGRLCIHKKGENACPSLDYAVRFVAYEKVDDTRACTTCTATPAGGGCGTKWGTRLKIQDCGDVLPPANDKDANGCYQYFGSGTIIDIGSMTPSAGTCTATGGAPTGTASSIDPVTFCCNF